MKDHLKGALILVGLGLLGACAAIYFAGCTITPRQTISKVPSLDNGELNSGVLGLTNHQYIVTSNLAARYNALVARYGPLEVPPVIQGFGVSSGPSNTFLMTKQAMEELGWFEYELRNGK